MQPDLELVSTRELIQEVMRRRNFLGVIVHSQEELRDAQWTDDRIFKVHFNGNLTAERAASLLDRVAAQLDPDLCED